MICEPIDIIYLLLELVILNLNATEGQMEFLGNLWCCTVPYI